MTRKKHVIIGAGSSGTILASQLLSSDDVILVTDGPGLETSYFDQDVFTDPMNWAYAAFYSDDCPLAYFNKSQSARLIKYGQGLGVGGCSNVNAMLWTQGSERVFDAYWPSSWSGQVMRKLVEEVETMVMPCWETAAEPVQAALGRGSSDEQSSHFHRYKSFTAEDSSSLYSTRRRKLMKDLLRQARSSSGAGSLTVIEFAAAMFIEFDEMGQRATGVRVRHIQSGVEEYLRPSHGGEIVLCAGVFESPRLLRQSIIRHVTDVPTVSNKDISSNKADNTGTLWDPEVFELLGSCLQDHLLVPLMFLSTAPWSAKSVPSATSGDTVPGKGPSNGIHGWIYLNDEGHPCDLHSSQSIPSIQLVFASGSSSLGVLDEMLLPRYAVRGAPLYPRVYMRYIRPLMVVFIKWLVTWWLVRWMSQFLCGVLVCVVRPDSRGTMGVTRRCRTAAESMVELTGTDTEADVDLNMCGDENDLIRLQNAIYCARMKIQVQHASRGAWYAEILPGPLFGGRSIGHLRRFVASFGNTYFHACGTCPMVGGKGLHSSNNSSLSRGVVDEQLRVVGVSGLRVADASVVPSCGIPNAPIQSMCMAIGLKAAKMIKTNNI